MTTNKGVSSLYSANYTVLSVIFKRKVTNYMRSQSKRWMDACLIPLPDRENSPREHSSEPHGDPGGHLNSQTHTPHVHQPGTAGQEQLRRFLLQIPSDCSHKAGSGDN